MRRDLCELRSRLAHLRLDLRHAVRHFLDRYLEARWYQLATVLGPLDLIAIRMGHLNVQLSEKAGELGTQNLRLEFSVVPGVDSARSRRHGDRFSRNPLDRRDAALILQDVDLFTRLGLMGEHFAGDLELATYPVDPGQQIGLVSRIGNPRELIDQVCQALGLRRDRSQRDGSLVERVQIPLLYLFAREQRQCHLLQASIPIEVVGDAASHRLRRDLKRHVCNAGAQRTPPIVR